VDNVASNDENEEEDLDLMGCDEPIVNQDYI
jgi:hypothetical protein